MEPKQKGRLIYVLFAFLFPFSLFAKCPTWEKDLEFVPIVQDAQIEGWEIRNLKTESAWARAGFAEKDLILRIGDSSALSAGEFRAQLAKLCNLKVTILVLRDKKVVKIPAEKLFQK